MSNVREILMVLYQMPYGRWLTVKDLKEHINLSEKQISNALVKAGRLVTRQKSPLGKNVYVYELSPEGINKMQWRESRGELG